MLILGTLSSSCWGGLGNSVLWNSQFCCVMPGPRGWHPSHFCCTYYWLGQLPIAIKFVFSFVCYRHCRFDDESYIFRPDPLGKIISLSLLITFLLGLTLLCLRSVKLLFTRRWKRTLWHRLTFPRVIFVIILLGTLTCNLRLIPAPSECSKIDLWIKFLAQ